jgi:hypothetical protein
LAQKPQRPALPENTIDRIFGGLGGVEYMLSKGIYVSGVDLAAAIERDRDEVLSDPVRDYLCRLLRGTVKQKRGPKTDTTEKHFYRIIGPIVYREALRRRQAEYKTRGGRRGRGELAPNEEALNDIRQEFAYFRKMSPRRLANFLSSHK